MNETCPSCGEAISGRFCSGCGAPAGTIRTCTECGNTPPPGAKFCNACGAPVAADQRGGSRAPAETARLPWFIAGVAVAVLAAVLLLPRLSSRGTPEAPLEPSATAAAAGVPGDPSRVDISSMTPRERADRLFNRVMQSVSSGDTAQARAFLPMAIAAYDQVPGLDLDGRYHLAVLHLVAEDPRSARAEAGEILEREPSHLFGLFTAAQAEAAMGRTEDARELYRAFLDSYDSEIERPLEEYRDHAQVLPLNREEAREAVGE